MLKKTITYTDLNDIEHAQELYFHLSKLELIAFSSSLERWRKQMMEVTKTMDFGAAVQVYREIVKSAIGLRSEDGSRFISTPEVKDDLMKSPAVDEMIYLFVMKPQEGFEFFENLMPKDVQERFRTAAQSDPDLAALLDTAAPELEQDNRPAWEKEGRMPTTAEFKRLDPEERKAVYAKTFGTIE
jgi:hypothetical protein